MGLNKKLQDATVAATMIERHRILQICQGLIDEARTAPPTMNTPIVLRVLMLVIKNVKSGLVPKVSGEQDGNNRGDPNVELRL